MAGQCRVDSSSRNNCVGISSSTQSNWWDQDQQVHTLSVSSSWPWHHRQQMQQQQPNPNSTNSSCDEDVSMSSTSFTNASNHSSLSVDSSRRPEDLNLIGEQVSDSQIWSQVLLSVGNSCDLNNNNITRGVGENFLDSISSKSLTNTAAMYEEAACDYLKKLDNSTGSNWENVTNSSNFNNFEKQINVNNSQFSSENLSNLVSTWSIAPPEPQVVNSTTNPFFMSMPQVSYYGPDDHNRKVENFESNLHGRPFSTSNGNAEYQIGLNNAMAADQSNYYGSCENGQILPDAFSPCANTGISRSNNADVISLSYNRLGKPVTNPNHHHALPKPGNFKSLIPDTTSKKQGLRTSSAQSTITSERVLQGTSINEGKKKRADESITSSGGTVVKKPKQETSTVNSSSTVKMQAPKVKLGERITALQQIVSPFGKTDTASVLYEAIQYIKFLQDQVNVLLSSPYSKTNSHNGKYDHAMGDQRGDVDLKSKGLCLVPTSCTPQVYRENTGSDYWPTPIYRGCLYR